MLSTKLGSTAPGVQVREDLIDMWERLGLTGELRGQIWEEIKIALRKEEEGYPVDMELLERCRLECGRLQAIREAGLAEACTRFEEWGKQRERCEQAWDELGTPKVKPRLPPVLARLEPQHGSPTIRLPNAWQLMSGGCGDRGPHAGRAQAVPISWLGDDGCRRGWTR